MGNTGATVYSLFDYWDLGGVKYTANGNTLYSDTIAETCILMRFASVWKKCRCRSPAMPRSR